MSVGNTHRMETFIGAPAIAVVSGALGFFIRSREFARDNRLKAYAEFADAFLACAHAGSDLFSLHITFGDSLYDERAGKATQAWAAWSQADKELESASTRVRLVGTKRVRIAANELDEYIEMNVRAVPPLRRGSPPDDWGNEATIGPAHVVNVAKDLAGEFADNARRVAPW